MPYLSNRDFYNEFGEEILIYPFLYENIKGASINLTVDEYAWDLNTKKMLSLVTIDGEKIFIVPPYAVIAIMTQEVIYVGKNICGTYHSKVGMTIKGFSNISTTLDPEYIGTSLICLQNNTPRQQEIVVGDVFATLMLAYVSQPVFDEMADKKNMPGQRERVGSFEKGDLFIKKQRDDGFHDSPKLLKDKMLNDMSFKKWKNDFLQKDNLLQETQEIEKKKENKKIVRAKVGLYLSALVLIVALVGSIIAVIERIPSLDFLKSYMPLIVFVLGFVINKYLRKVMAFIERKINKSGDEK